MEKLKSCSFYFLLSYNIKRYFVFLFVTVAFITNGFFISTAHADVTYVLDEVLEENTHWTIDESPYLITQSLSVDEGITLTIDPGAVVKFEDEARLVVFGSLEVGVTEGDSIYFTSSKDDSLGGDTNLDENDTTPNKNDWGGIVIIPKEDGSIMESSTLNNLVSKYSSDGLLVFDTSVSSIGLDIDNQILLFNSNSTFNKLVSDKIDLFETSVVTIDGSILNSADGSVAVRVSDASKLDISNSSINGCQDCGSTILVFGASSLSLDNVQINIENKSEYTFGIGIFDEGTNLIMKKSTEIGANMGMIIDTGAKAKVEDSVFECIDRCIEGDGGSLLMTNSKISGASEFGILSSDSPRTSYECKEIYNEDGEIEELCEDVILEGSLFEINNNEIFGNGVGINSYGGKIIGEKNNIHNNTIGASNISEEEGGDAVDLKNNFWGDKTGPTHSSNPEGVGDIVSDNILFEPFLKSDPLIEKTGISSVMLIPGFEASRMYKMKSILGLEVEDRLWELNSGSDVRDLYMDQYGISIDNDIYARDIIDTASLYGIGVKKFYRSFMDQMDELVTKDEIAGWKSIAYDWRLSPTDIVNRGIENEDGNISYNEELIGGQVPYIIDQFQKLADSSKSGKVTIVVHSNGGLVAKALVYKLNEMKEKEESDLVDNIDNIIFVGSPLLGTPEAIPALLHGQDQGKALNLLLSRKNARSFGQNVPGAYNLLPSEEYMDEIDNDLITLDESLDKLNNWRKLYGDAVDNYDELGKFLSGVDGGRLQSSYDDLRTPLILNESLFDKAKVFHDNLADLVFPETMKIHQVAGWGIPTAYDLRYKTKNECDIFLLVCIKKELVLSSDVGLVSGGDGTVIADTALVGEGTDYYLNLGEYNKDNKFSSHANMFDVSFLFDLVHNIIKGDSSLPEYITTTQPSPVDFTVIKMHSPVAIDIYNEAGSHTGMVENDDPNLEFIEENIPNSSYREVGDEKYLIVPRDENYRLELTGLSDGIFTLEQESIINDLPADSVVFRDISTTSSLRGEVDIRAYSLATSISLDKEGDGIFESSIFPSIGEEDENIQPERPHSSFGSIPLVINKIPEAKIDIPISVVNIPDAKDVIISNMKEISLEKIKYNLLEDTKSNKNTEITNSELDTYNPNISASVGDNGIINKRIVILGIVASLILLIGFILIFKIKI